MPQPVAGNEWQQGRWGRKPHAFFLGKKPRPMIGDIHRDIGELPAGNRFRGIKGYVDVAFVGEGSISETMHRKRRKDQSIESGHPAWPPGRYPGGVRAL